MNNAKIKRKLNMGHNFHSEMQIINQLVSKHRISHFDDHKTKENIINKTLLVQQSPNQPNSKFYSTSNHINNKLIKYDKIIHFEKFQSQGSSFYFTPLNRVVWQSNNPIQLLKPKQASLQLKQIQKKIHKLSKKLTKNSQKDEKIKKFQTFIHNSNLEKLLGCQNNPNIITEKDQIKFRQLEQSSFEEWHKRAIETHLKQSDQKISMNYALEQDGFKKKTIISERELGRTLYPKLSNGFKKRAVSYEIKYI